MYSIYKVLNSNGQYANITKTDNIENKITYGDRGCDSKIRIHMYICLRFHPITPRDAEKSKMERFPGEIANEGIVAFIVINKVYRVDEIR